MDGLTALVAAGARLAALGLSPGSSGNLSVRHGSGIAMSPSGAALGSLEVDGLAILDAAGARISGGSPSKEVPLHLAMYRRGFGAVVHLHSPWAMAASCLPPWSERSAIAPLSPYFVMRVGQTPLVPYLPPGDPRLGEAIDAIDFAIRAALLANHGLVAAGADLAEAVDAAIELEEACRLQVLVGDRARLLPAGEAVTLAARSGTPWDG